MYYMKISKYFSLIFLIILPFIHLPVHATEGRKGEIESEAQRASVKFYTNKDDGRLWLRIKPNSDHYRELMVTLPDGKKLVLVLGDIFISPPLKNFSSRVEFNFPDHELIGKFWKDDEEQTVKIFKQRGIYTFYFAENIETEPENTWHEYVKVKY